MTTYVYRDGELIERDIAPPLTPRGPVSAFSFQYISDQMSETRHMADGKIYTSKKAFRDATRAANCVEIGDHKFKPRERIKMSKQERGQHIKEAIDQLKAGAPAKKRSGKMADSQIINASERCSNSRVADVFKYVNHQKVAWGCPGI